MDTNSPGTEKREKSNLRYMDDVEDDLKTLAVRRWTRKGFAETCKRMSLKIPSHTIDNNAKGR